MQMRSPWLFVVVSMSLLALAGQPTRAADHVLTIGGGYSPAGNQVSLERNVIFFGKLLAERLPAGTRHDLYFADGTSSNPDLQFRVEGDRGPRANRYMAGLFGTEDNLENHYRDHRLDGVRGMSSPAEVERWFKEEGAKLTTGDRLILYVTAHGGKSSQKENRFNTKIWMWDRQSIDASRLAGWIDGLPDGVSVVTVMVQCFSGGFSHLVFEENDADEGDCSRDICGFFATVHDREAAGCTPDVNEANYDEFSSHFWAAMRGSTRLDEPVAEVDYDGDGGVSFEEAHAYAVLNSRNIDIPVKTSDAFLRVHSELGSKDRPELMDHATPYPEILERADPVQRIVLEGLSTQLDLANDDRGTEMKRAADRLGKELEGIDERKKSQKKTLDGVRREIAQTIRNRWPALENKHSPGAVRLLSDEDARADFVAAVESDAKFAEWQELEDKHRVLDAEELELAKKYATHRRFVRVFENVAYAANLAAVADEDIQARYAQVLAAERTKLEK